MSPSRSHAAPLKTLIDVIRAPSVTAGAALLIGLPSAEVSSIIQLARVHGIEAWLAACAPRNEPAWLGVTEQRARFHAARMRDSAVIEDLTRAFGRLECPWVVVKGPALGQSVYPRPELRFGVDLDVLVPPSQFGEVLTALVERERFELLDQNWPVIDATSPGELRVRSPRGVLVDLHWSLINVAAVRRDLRLSTRDLLSRSRRLDSGMPALSADDQLIHLGLHGALSGANKLSWLLDAHLAASQVEDWQPIIQRSRAFGTSAMLAVVLARARQVWNTPIPPPVLRSMSGGRLPYTVGRIIDGASPVGPDPDLHSISRAWARSIRSSPKTSLHEVAKHGAEWLRGGHLRVRPRSHINEASDARSPLHPVNDPRLRERYLAMVATQA